MYLIKIFILISLCYLTLLGDFIRDTTYGIVIDTSNNLIWQDDRNSSTTSWENIINPNLPGNNYCANSDLAGFTDWRLANINELKSIIDYSSSEPTLNQKFQNVPVETNNHMDYLSSTSFTADKSKVWSVNFYNGTVIILKKDGSSSGDTMYFRCVRNR